MKLPPAGPGKHWMGVLIMVPDPLASIAHAIRVASGDRLADEVGPHITLCAPFQTEIDATEDVVERVRATVASTPPFMVEVDGSASFQPVSPVTYLQVVRGVRRCSLLAGRLHNALGMEPAYPYHPHITLAYGVSSAALDAAQAAGAHVRDGFEVRRVSVFTRDDSEHWQMISQHRLGVEE